MILVRGSEVQDYLRCRKRWQYRWIERLEALKPNGKLFFGNLFHKFMQTYYNYLNDPREMPADHRAWQAMWTLFEETDTRLMEQTELDELWALAENVTENYVKQWKEYDKDIEVVATELRFAIPLDDDTMYEGTIDMIWLKDGKLYFKDYKTTITIDKYRDKAEMDRQISRYWWALQQLARGNGYIWVPDLITKENQPEGSWMPIRVMGLGKQLKEPSGFIYDVVLRDYPKQPEPLKKGGLSKAKNQKTTYDVYRNALREHLTSINGVEPSPARWVPEEYIEIMEHLAAQETEYGNRFFQRIPVSRLQPEIDAAMNEFYAVALESQELKKSVNFNISKAESRCYRNITDDCKWDCEFKMLCVAEMDGSNARMIKNLAYRQKEVEVTTWLNI